MSSQFTSAKQDIVTLAAQVFAAFRMCAPGEALFGIKLDLEQAGKTIDCISGLSHVIDIVEDDSPIVNVRHRTKESIATSKPSVEQLSQNHHGNAGHGASLRKSIARRDTW